MSCLSAQVTGTSRLLAPHRLTSSKQVVRLKRRLVAGPVRNLKSCPPKPWTGERWANAPRGAGYLHSRRAVCARVEQVDACPSPHLGRPASTVASCSRLSTQPPAGRSRASLHVDLPDWSFRVTDGLGLPRPATESQPCEQRGTERPRQITAHV